MQRGRRWVVGLALMAPGIAPAFADEPPAPRGYVCRRVGGPIRVDGAIDEEAWAGAEWSAPFVDIEGSRKPDPTYPTRVKMLWDADTLFVAAEITEPHVWAYLTDHDSIIFQDNDFEVFIDPDGDNHRYFEVEINARNTEWDLFLHKPYRDGGPADNSWEIPGLRKAVRVRGTLNQPDDTDTGWTVELAIPFRDLAHAGHRTELPRVGDRWRINFSRVEWDTTVADGRYVKVQENGKPRPEHNWVWSPQGVIDMHQPEHWGYLQFADDAATTYRPDPAAPVRDDLMRIYRAVRDRQKANKPWDGTLEQLDLKPADFRVQGASLPVVRWTPAGFEATMSFQAAPERPVQVWTIDQDSHLTHRP